MSFAYKILVLDDDKLVTDSLKSLLMIEGFDDVVFFNSPFEALEYLKSSEREVIISDFMMPQMNGIEFLSSAKQICNEASTILLTGYADKENAIKAINEAGIYKYIEKPWDNDELVLNIRNAGERANLIKKLSEKNEQLKKYSENLENILKQKSADLYEAKERLSAIISNCADGIITLTKSKKVADVNPAAELMFGLSLFMLQSKNFNELVFGKSKDMLFSRDENMIIGDLEIENYVNGKKIPVEISVSALPCDEKEDSIKYVLVIRDITLQKDAERLREDFIATLTHDLRTPAMAAVQTLEYFLKGKLGDLTDKQTMFLDNLKKSNEDMLGLVNTLLEVYKYEAGHLNLVKTVFSFTELLRECIERVQSLADSKSQTILKEYDENDEMKISADRNELRRVIINLLGNAVKYTQEGGVIEVKAQIDNSDIRFSVKDNGEGIFKQDIPKLFKRFSQGTKEKRSISTGLGLYLSKQIIDAHGGKIWLESDKGKGSEFFILLPDACAEKEKEAVWKV